MPKPRRVALKAGALRKVLAAEKAGWQVAEHLADTAAIPAYGIGTKPDGLKTARRVKAIDFNAVFHEVPMNPFLVQRARVHKFSEARDRRLLNRRNERNCA